MTEPAIPALAFALFCTGYLALWLHTRWRRAEVRCVEAERRAGRFEAESRALQRDALIGKAVRDAGIVAKAETLAAKPIPAPAPKKTVARKRKAAA
jgi:hypothetical protein